MTVLKNARLEKKPREHCIFFKINYLTFFNHLYFY